MNHLEFAASESAALEPTDCEQWLDKVEILFGHNIDGNQKEDGYSIDFCVHMFDAGIAVETAVNALKWLKKVHDA